MSRAAWVEDTEQVTFLLWVFVGWLFKFVYKEGIVVLCCLFVCLFRSQGKVHNGSQKWDVLFLIEAPCGDALNKDM